VKNVLLFTLETMRFLELACLALPVVALPSVTQRQTDPAPFFYKGHDLSSQKTSEDSGFIYFDTARHNKSRTADAILADGGMNSVRLRLWVNPPGGANGLPYTLELAARYQAAGYKIYLDFHFADSWADPSKQPIPAGWSTTSLTDLSATLRQYVSSTLVSFQNAGIELSLVSLGNEIRNGMLWPLGEASVDIEPWSATVESFAGLSALYTAARAGVDDAVLAGVTKPQVMIHIDDGWNLTIQERWFGALTANGVPTTAWDVFGFSFYPFYGTGATLAALNNSLTTLALQYGKPLHVVETDYPAVCNGEFNPIPPSSEPEIPYDVQGQITWTDDVISVVQQVPNGLGQGVHYWEPAWLNNTSLGSACNDALLFEADFDKFPLIVGYSRPSVNIFG